MAVAALFVAITAVLISTAALRLELGRRRDELRPAFEGRVTWTEEGSPTLSIRNLGPRDLDHVDLRIVSAPDPVAGFIHDGGQINGNWQLRQVCRGAWTEEMPLSGNSGQNGKATFQCFCDGRRWTVLLDVDWQPPRRFFGSYA